ncbi:hypothetical protein QRX60_45520 [Amycolatopsis mongoliensis]|uniref:Sigma-54 factor interaction domain-containing protein n=1 Tax=Amycolatopsis mongoliensis TaxID=715475 RepID=A0A9Y2JPG5_9PSEU|nr:hypothetical protein [Amycolatopsis sp. 4-36]WIY01221.1 hypothetical protein QRX60_45520 [Amycolatopsis sp. 4-36]
MAHAVAVRHGRRALLLDCAGLDDRAAKVQALADDVAGGRPPVVTLQHADALTGEALQRVADLLTTWRAMPADQGPAWVAATVRDEAPGPDVQLQLMPFFTRAIDIPPLRHRIEDLRRLVPHLLGRHSNQDVAVSDTCLRQLMRLPWPGNVRQLGQVLSEASRQRRTGTIEVTDLPAECRMFTRRQLTKLETIEYEARPTSACPGPRSAACSLSPPFAARLRTIARSASSPISAAAGRALREPGRCRAMSAVDDRVVDPISDSINA